LFATPGAEALLLIAVALFVAWSYSAPPLTLHATGLGEMVAAFVLAMATPLLGYVLQGGQLGWRPVSMLTPLWCYQLVMLIVVSLPDVPGDRSVGKATLAVRLGAGPVRRLSAAVLVVGAGLVPVPLLFGAPVPFVVAAVVWVPLAAWLAWRLIESQATDPEDWSGVAFWSIGLVMGTAASQALALLSLRP
jgi:1,4-dihydroxy-2-naphthoate octaprenyltransferase